MSKLKPLPNYTKSLLLHGAKTTGTFTDGYYYIEESLYAQHANTLLQFCQWIDQNIGGAGSANIDMLFSAFTNPTDPLLQQKANELAERISKLKGIA